MHLFEFIFISRIILICILVSMKLIQTNRTFTFIGIEKGAHKTGTQ